MKANIKYFNLSREEWNAIRSLADDRNVVTKKADKGLCIVIWGRNDSLMEAEKQLSDKKVYQEVSNSENILSKLVEMCNKMFSSLKKRSYITEKQLKYFPMNIEIPQILVNSIFFPKLIKDCIMFQEDLLFQIAVHPQKNTRNF